ncbi:MAG: type II secretion system minor pseudopilin GspI [Legionellaceae bacterium]|nr:type II secretion system minor pseudopilin GspI [Legionellaceae bacterium]
MTLPTRSKAFTLIEVLIALVIIAISLTALIRSTGQNIQYTNRLQEKTLKHWVARQGINMIQNGDITDTNRKTLKTRMLNQDWYWRPLIKATPLKKIKKIVIYVSRTEAGPFEETLTGYQLRL